MALAASCRAHVLCFSAVRRGGMGWRWGHGGPDRTHRPEKDELGLLRVRQNGLSNEPPGIPLGRLIDYRCCTAISLFASVGETDAFEPLLSSLGRAAKM